MAKESEIIFSKAEAAKLPKLAPIVSKVRHSLVPVEVRDLNEQLIQAAWDNNLAEVKRLVQAGADINYQDGNTESAYQISTSEGYLEMLRFFIENGNIKLAIRDRYNGTGTIRAAERGHGEVVYWLWTIGDDADHINNPGYTALIESIIFGNADYNYTKTVLILAAISADFSLHKATAAPLDEALKMGQSHIAKIIQGVLDSPQKSHAEAQALLQNAVEQEDIVSAAIALRHGAIVKPSVMEKVKALNYPMLEEIIGLFGSSVED